MVVDVVPPVIIKVHQSLHGYSDGHRQLACSAKLSQDDAKLVLTMSDVSGSGVVSEGNSYLTGYPLKDLGMYALAKTWPAPEMPRPGCVWTHTIYIEYADLATVFAPSRLAELFSRPESASWTSYGVPTSMSLLDCDEREPSLSLQDEQWLTTVLNALYKSPRERVATKFAPSVSVEALTLRIWDQQWPRLRRSFRFCTLTTKDRSMPGVAFDLQVLPINESSGRMRHAGVVEAMPSLDIGQPDWLMTLLDDARQPNLGGLRNTLRRLGADILGGREAMSTLCVFHRAISRSTSPADLHQAIAMVDGQGLLSRSDVARALLVEYILSVVEDVDELVVTFLWDNWQFIDTQRLRNGSAQLAATLWRVFPKRLLAVLSDDAVEKANWAAGIIRSLHAKDLLEGWPDVDVPLRPVLANHPELLDMPAFWKRVEVRSLNDLHGIEVSEVGVGALIDGMDHSSAMSVAVQWLGPLRVLDALQARSHRTDWTSSELRWVPYCVRDSSVIAEFLSRVQAPSLQLVQALAGQLDPDTVPNQYGDDPWFTTLLKLRETHGPLPLGLAAYGFARALGWSSRSVAELLQMTFEQLHGAVTNSALEDGAWQLIERRLPWVPEERRWNRGERLRKIVVEVFVSRRLWPRTFARMADNTEVYIALMEETADRWGGKRFLKSVEESLEDAQDTATQARRELIHWFLRRGRSK